MAALAVAVVASALVVPPTPVAVELLVREVLEELEDLVQLASQVPAAAARYPMVARPILAELVAAAVLVAPTLAWLSAAVVAADVVQRERSNRRRRTEVEQGQQEECIYFQSLERRTPAAGAGAVAPAVSTVLPLLAVPVSSVSATSAAQ